MEETAPPASLDPQVESIAPSDEPAISNTEWTSSTVYDGGAPVAGRLGFDTDGNVTFIENGKSVSGITWTRSGNNVTITFENGFSTETGTINGDTITTTGRNKDGVTWTAVYTKVS